MQSNSCSQAPIIFSSALKYRFFFYCYGLVCQCVCQSDSSGALGLQEVKLQKVENFIHLSLTVWSNEECRKVTNEFGRAGWNGWQNMSGVLLTKENQQDERKSVEKIGGRAGGSRDENAEFLFGIDQDELDQEPVPVPGTLRGHVQIHVPSEKYFSYIN